MFWRVKGDLRVKIRSVWIDRWLLLFDLGINFSASLPTGSLELISFNYILSIKTLYFVLSTSTPLHHPLHQLLYITPSTSSTSRSLSVYHPFYINPLNITTSTSPSLHHSLYTIPTVTLKLINHS